MRCGDCRFYSNPGVKLGDCRVRPPQPTEEEDDRWPTVWSHEFCGSFQPRGPEQPPA